jgi:hypothetical protein
MAPGRTRRAIGAKPENETETKPVRTPGVSAGARNAASRTDRGLNASLKGVRRRVRGSGRLARRDTV